LEHIGAGQTELNTTEVLRNIHELSTKVIEGLKKKSKRVTNSMLLDVATISANNDGQIGRIIAEVYKDVGKNGIVTVERSQTSREERHSNGGAKPDE
jgi:chaperonin GroEL